MTSFLVLIVWCCDDVTCASAEWIFQLKKTEQRKGLGLHRVSLISFVSILSFYWLEPGKNRSLWWVLLAFCKLRITVTQSAFKSLNDTLNCANPTFDTFILFPSSLLRAFVLSWNALMLTLSSTHHSIHFLSTFEILWIRWIVNMWYAEWVLIGLTRRALQV